MNAGPSREQLESLYKTSRKYFDEMAKEYYVKDREFYDKNFAPFYSNPLLNTKSGAKPVRLVILIVVSIAVTLIIFAVSFFLTKQRPEVKPVKQSEKYQDPAKSEKSKDPLPTEPEDRENAFKDSVEKSVMKYIDEELQKKGINIKENTSKREVKSKPMERNR
jgi:hypothetical protein